MALDTIDRAMEIGNLQTESSKSSSIRIYGSENWKPTIAVDLKREFDFPSDICIHLANNYGDRAFDIARLAKMNNLSKRLDEGYPFIEAEVIHVVRNEYASTAIDVLARRLRLSFLNYQAALNSLPRVIDLLSTELKWNSQERKNQITLATLFIKSMKSPLN